MKTKPQVPRLPLALTVVISVSLGWTAGARANGYGENASSQFHTMADNANMAAIANFIQQKRGGYYNSFGSAFNTNTTNISNIDHQIDSSSTTMSDNTVTVLGQGNSDGNGLASSSSSIDTAAAILNDQSISSTVNASTSDVRAISVPVSVYPAAFRTLSAATAWRCRRA